MYAGNGLLFVNACVKLVGGEGEPDEDACCCRTSPCCWCRLFGADGGDPSSSVMIISEMVGENRTLLAGDDDTGLGLVLLDVLLLSESLFAAAPCACCCGLRSGVEVVKAQH
jgi:hypothetical protein